MCFIWSLCIVILLFGFKKKIITIILNLKILYVPYAVRTKITGAKNCGKNITEKNVCAWEVFDFEGKKYGKLREVVVILVAMMIFDKESSSRTYDPYGSAISRTTFSKSKILILLLASSISSSQMTLDCLGSDFCVVWFTVRQFSQIFSFESCIG